MRYCFLILFVIGITLCSCSVPQETLKVVVISSGVINPANDGITVVSIEVQPTVSNVTKEFEKFGEKIV
mgnify:CR=1 FL=1